MERNIIGQKEDEAEFNKGVELLRLKEFKNAQESFKKAYSMAHNKGVYLSYYGLSMALAGGNPQVAVELCNKAIKLECYNADFYLNLGRVYYSCAKNRGKAISALKQGLKFDRNHAEIIKELSIIGSRSNPVVPFLSRDSVVNVYLGKLKRFLNEL